MAYRDAVITLDEDRTTYAQTVDKALTAERVENQTWRENAGRREQRRSAPPQFDSDKGSSDHQKRKVPNSSVPSGPSAKGRGAPGGRQSDTSRGDRILYMKDVIDVIIASASSICAILMKVLVIARRIVHSYSRRMQ